MSLEVRIALRSDAAPGSGAGGPEVDRDVVTDEIGLPVIPGRRLKGLLREAAQEVYEAFTLAGNDAWPARSLCPTDRLFGTPERAGLIRIGDARLAALDGLAASAGEQAAAELREWLTWARQGGDGGLLRSEALLPSLTVVRRQTAIDPGGAARTGALRSSRLLRRGLRFTGPLDLSASDQQLEARARRSLALACAALRRLGSARHRGPGRVDVQLWDSAAGNITAAALAALDQPPAKRGTS